jgi:hypothetical protein
MILDEWISYRKDFLAGQHERFKVFGFARCQDDAQYFHWSKKENAFSSNLGHLGVRESDEAPDSICVAGPAVSKSGLSKDLLIDTYEKLLSYTLCRVWQPISDPNNKAVDQRCTRSCLSPGARMMTLLPRAGCLKARATSCLLLPEPTSVLGTISIQRPGRIHDGC